MKKILLHLFMGSDRNLFDPHARDQIFQPFIYLRERLKDLGYSLEQTGNQSLDECAWVFFFDYQSVIPYQGMRGKVRRLAAFLKGKTPERPLFRECIQVGMADRVVLFLWEGPGVQPPNWKPSLHRLFPNIFTWNDRLVQRNDRARKFHLPQPDVFPSIHPVAFSQKKLLINISMNKHSTHSRSLYGERLKAIRYFQKHYPDDFDLYGYGWERPLRPGDRLFPSAWRSYPTYRGAVAHKWEVLPRYRFSISYENLKDEPGYVSERIFDSMRSGCVPIYWGAPNITDYVDQEAFIDRRRFANHDELARYLKDMPEAEYNRYQEAMKDYLASDRFARFLPPAFADTIIRALGL